ncbi:hypothetical protein [Curtobacterium sp. MCBD17_032]|uniref:hypothetical protein n=1 Tax=Curtobacterium sp. MCBD17_032 TaxID=2175659 RepID=UPI000DA85741|nr:hypothetical protein [Curtobacterium sp. MCBD17_032]PZE86365.1 hypothetical protein DEI91_04535 [Curtobacterium sp. MCBD17_032]
MPWFGRKKPTGDAPSLAVLAQRTLAERGVETTVDGDPADPAHARLLGADGQVYLLANLAVQVRGENDARRALIVGAHFDRMLQAHSEPPPEDLGADELRDRIRLRLLAEDGADPTDLTYARPFAPGLVLALCVDYPTMVSTLSTSALPKLALGSDELWAMGRFNTDAEPVDANAEIAPGVHIVEGESLFTATKAVNLPALFGAAPFGTVVAIPHRHLLLAVPLRDADSVQAVQTLAGLLVRVLGDRDAGLPGGLLSPDLLFSRHGHVSPVSSYDQATGELRIEVDERFQEALEEAVA